VYLTYSIFILTSAMRMSSFSLNIRPDPAPQPAATSSKLGLSPSAVPEQSPPSYISLLGDKPFLPTVRSGGLPHATRLSLSEKDRRAELVITPDNLRFIAETVERITSDIRDTRIAHEEAERRADLQRQEFSRQQGKCRELVERIEQLRDARDRKYRAKFSDVQALQKQLLSRTDRLLQTLMDKASPGLSEDETQWLEELKKMKSEVGGSRYDGATLVARVAMVRLSVDCP
jgi:nucleoporin NUP82